MKTDIQTELTQALRSHEKVWANEEKTILAKNILLDLVEKTDPTIIGLLLGNDELKRHFFVEVNGVLVFKLQDFRFFLDKHRINNSYTKYANRIGLTDGKQPVGEIKRHSDGTPAENLIIKGNNLIALHSLAKQFKGKVKLIYIDPPYNTGNDGFKYNDKFNHSTWLTFMKNRLEIAKTLLADDGVIFVSIDENEHAYLKILMDEIFNRENFIGELIRKTKSTTNDVKTGFNIQHEYLLIFAKDKSNIFLLGEEKDFSNYKNPDNDPNGDWTTSDPTATDDGRKIKNVMEIKNPYTGKIDIPGNGKRWRFNEQGFYKLLEEGRLCFKKEHKPNERGFFLKRYKNELKSDFLFLNSLDTVDNKFLNQVATKELIKLFDNKFFDFPKPESLYQIIIQSCTNQGDIVLDYHLGSGTTAAVAHKMNRQYIGIEQMDYIETLAVERLKKVIEGEQGGISKAVNWQGGGEFVYAELAPFNETAKQQILTCENSDDIKTLFNELYERYFLKYNVSVDEFSQMINEPEFQALPLDEQKQMVLEMLDLNQMYVSLSEMDDEQFVGCLNDDDKALSRAFYQAEKKDGE